MPRVLAFLQQLPPFFSSALLTPRPLVLFSGKSFREQQCEKYNAYNYTDLEGNLLQWVPKYAGVSPRDRCKLFCRARGRSEFKVFEAKVRIPAWNSDPQAGRKATWPEPTFGLHPAHHPSSALPSPPACCRWLMAPCVGPRLWPSVSGASVSRLAVTTWWTRLGSWTNVGCVGAKATRAGRSPVPSTPPGGSPQEFCPQLQERIHADGMGPRLDCGCPFIPVEH